MSVADDSIVFVMRAGKSRIIDRAVREDAAKAEILAIQPEVIRGRIRVAKLLRRVDQSAHFVYESCASLGEWGERYGFSAREARLLASVAKAIELQPALESSLIDGTLTFDAAGVLGKVLDCPELAKNGADWIEKAVQLTARQLMLQASRALKEVAEGEPTSVLVATMTSTGREKFERARVIACRKQNKILDEGQAVEVLSDHYLDSFDEDRVKPGTRRLGDPSGTKIRTVPSAVSREVKARSGGVCEFPLCENEIWTELDHDIPHCRGGSQETANLDELCRRHHRYKHRGLIKKEVREDGTVVWVIRTITEDPKRNGNGRIRAAPKRGNPGRWDRGHDPPG